MEKTMEKNGSSLDEWTENHRWFRTHYQQLARQYDRRIVCIYRRKVVDHDNDVRRLMSRVRKKYPVDRVVVEFVSRKKRELIL